MRNFGRLLSVGLVLLAGGCSSSAPVTHSANNSNPASTSVPTSSEAETVVTIIAPGLDAQTKAQEALILAEPGDVIEFAEGTFEFNGTLSLNGVDNITIRGRGLDKSILNFSGQRRGSGGEGLKIKADKFTIQDLTLQNTPGDAIKIEDSHQVAIRRLRTWWTRGPDVQNGAYGIYPVMCSDVLIEHCVAECASDAGIYVGQTQRAIIRNNRATGNVAGIEIENTVGADVYSNETWNNTGGLLVFSLPGLKQKNGSHCRLYKNQVHDNNHRNFANEGAIVSTVPPGTGVMIMANDFVEVFENDIHDNDTMNCGVLSFLIAQRKFNDPEYDPFPEAISIHDNKFAGGGKSPNGDVGKMYEKAAGLPMPDIIYDGLLNESKLVDGKLPTELGISITNNGDATFANLGLASMLQGGAPLISKDLTPFTAKFESLEPTTVVGAD